MSPTYISLTKIEHEISDKFINECSQIIKDIRQLPAKFQNLIRNKREVRILLDENYDMSFIITNYDKSVEHITGNACVSPLNKKNIHENTYCYDYDELDEIFEANDLSQQVAFPVTISCFVIYETFITDDF